jgi:hypothetical protein
MPFSPCPVESSLACEPTRSAGWTGAYQAAFEFHVKTEDTAAFMTKQSRSAASSRLGGSNSNDVLGIPYHSRGLRAGLHHAWWRANSRECFRDAWTKSTLYGTSSVASSVIIRLTVKPGPVRGSVRRSNVHAMPIWVLGQAPSRCVKEEDALDPAAHVSRCLALITDHGSQLLRCVENISGDLGSGTI